MRSELRTTSIPDETTKNKGYILHNNQKAAPENMERPFDCLKITKLMIHGSAVLPKKAQSGRFSASAIFRMKSFVLI